MTGLDFTTLKPPGGDQEAAGRARAAQQLKEDALAEPSWDEVWVLGYTTGTGTFKKAILKTVEKGSLDYERVIAVKRAIENGELGMENPSLRKFTKAQALRLYKVYKEQQKDSILAKLVKETPDHYRIIQTEDSLELLVRDLEREPIIAVDTETTGLDVYNDVIVGMSFTLPVAGYSVYIPVAHNTKEPQLRRNLVLNRLRKVLAYPFVKKVLHNARYDLHMFIRHGLQVRGVAHDTMLAMRILNENEPSYALKKLATKYGKYIGHDAEANTFEELFGKDAKFADVPLDVALVYAAKDTELTWKLYQWQKENLRKVGHLDRLYRETENPLIDTVVMMEQTGFLIDLDFAREYGDKLQAEIMEAEQTLADHFGTDVNYNSPVQLAGLLFDKLKLPDISKKRSTDVKILKKLRDKHPGVEALLKYRKLTKMYGTYIEALPGQVKADGRVHGSFNQLSTVTGRFSSNNPNLQNIPPDARKLIISPPGKLILGSDYSQIEPRVLAHMSGDLHFQEPYKKGQDLYATLASRVFKVPVSECGDGSVWRKKMKVGLLAVMYGTSMWTLSEQLGITVQEAHQFILDFYEAYPDVYRFIKETHAFVKENEYVLTLAHRKRRFPGHRRGTIVYDRLAGEICRILGTREVPFDFWDSEKLPYKLKRDFQRVKGDVERVRRMAVNARIQGSAADIMKQGLLNLYKLAVEKGWDVMGTVHDEALILVPDTVTLDEVLEIESCMVRAGRLEIPVEVDTEIMTRWGEGLKKHEYFAKVA
jgi:DNA polymerase-1